jgi:hypothetical protein
MMLSPDQLPLGGRAPMLIWHWAIADAPGHAPKCFDLELETSQQASIHRFSNLGIWGRDRLGLGLRRSTLTAVHVAATEE